MILAKQVFYFGIKLGLEFRSIIRVILKDNLGIGVGYFVKRVINQI